MESDRQTGRTTRAMMDLVEECIREGVDGIYVVRHQAMVHHARDMLLKMYHPRFFTRAGPNYVEVGSGIRISFLPYTDDLEKRLKGKDYAVRYDHYVWESQRHVKKTTDS